MNAKERERNAVPRAKSALTEDAPSQSVGPKQKQRPRPSAQTTTISAWVNVTELGEDWIDAVCFGTHGHVLALEETGLPLGGMQGSETCEFVGTTVVAPGEWYMLTMTRDADSMIRIYTNGVLEAEQACTKMLSEDNSELQIGSCEGWEEFFNGAIDDVVIYNRPLSSDEIMTLYCEDGWCG